MSPLLLLLSALACRPPAGPPLPPQPLSLQVARSLSAGSVVAAMGQLQAVERGDGAACAALGALGEVAGAASDALLSEAPTYPALEIDVSTCFGLMTEPPVGATVAPLVASVVDLVLREAGALLALYGGSLACEVRAPIAAAIDWVAGAAGPVLEELGQPDGVLSVPAVSWECD